MAPPGAGGAAPAPRRHVTLHDDQTTTGTGRRRPAEHGGLAPRTGADADAPARPSSVVVGLEVCDRLVLVHLAGELDVLTGPALGADLEVLRPPGDRSGAGPSLGGVRLDLSSLTFLDTTGLAALVATTAALTRWGWSVCWLEPQGPVLAMLRIAILFGWLPLLTPRASACAGTPEGPDVGLTPHRATDVEVDLGERSPSVWHVQVS